MESYVYFIDAKDHITSLSPNWSRFAMDNASAGLSPDTVLGKRLWDFVEGAETRTVYKHLFERARKLGIAAGVPFRCDAPEMTRSMLLTISPSGDFGLRLESTILATETRPAEPLLDPASHRSEEFVIVCGWCKKVQLDIDRWAEIETAVCELDLLSHDRLPRLSHSICPLCCEAVEQEPRRAP